MNKKKAKLIFKHNYFKVLDEGDYVLCAVSGKVIPLQNLNAVAVRSHSFGEYTDVIFYSFRFADCLGNEDL